MSASHTIAFPNSAGPRHPAPEDLTLLAMELFSPTEAAPIAQHVESCSECRAELARIYGDLALTAATVDIETPSAQSRVRLVEQVAREKKNHAIPGRSSAESSRSNETVAQADSHPPIAAFGRSGSISSIEDRPQKRVGRNILAFAGWAIAAGLAVAVALQHKDRSDLSNTLATQQSELERLNTDAASSHRLMDALTDPVAVRVTLTAKPLPKAQPIGGVTYNPNKGSLIFLASNLPRKGELPRRSDHRRGCQNFSTPVVGKCIEVIDLDLQRFDLHRVDFQRIASRACAPSVTLRTSYSRASAAFS